MNDYLDAFGQQAGLGIYTQLCFCFSVSDDVSYSKTIDSLTKGLEQLSANFPWVAGQVVREEGIMEGSPGLFKIISSEATPRLVVRDHRDEPDAPKMDDLRRASFPFRMLDEDTIAPRKTLPTPADSELDSPVFLVQINIILGGLILTFNGQHQTMDMTGQGQIIHLLSRACHGDSFTDEELSIGNLRQHNLIPLIDNYKPGSELARQICKPSLTHPPSAPLPESVWAYFTFSASSLIALKSIASNTLSSGYVSTDDTLSAFIWQSIAHARLPRLGPTAESTFARAVDPRRYLNIPKTYPGLVQNMTYHSFALQTLIESPLGTIAAHLRSAVDPRTSDIGYRTRALATILHNSPERSDISVTATLDLSADIMLSSWANIDSYDLDFNLGLGKPEAVRRPQFTPFESLFYLMPRTLDGEIAAAICLRFEDMERLSRDDGFLRYGRYVP